MAKKSQPLSFDELIASQRRLAAQGDKVAESQIDKFTEMQKSLTQLEDLSKQDRLLQAVQTIEAVKADKDDDKIVVALEKLEKETKKGLLDKTGDGLNANIVKLMATMKASNDGTIEKGTPTSSPIAQQAQSISDNAREQAGQFKPTMKESIVGGFKKLGTLEGWFDTSAERRDKGTLIDNAIMRKKEKRDYMNEQSQMNPTASGDPAKDKERFGKQYEVVNRYRDEAGQSIQQVDELKKKGFTEDQIARTGAYDKISRAEKMVAVADPLVRERMQPATPIKETESLVTPLDAVSTSEEEAEANRAAGAQVELLKKIEENTRPTQSADQATQPTQQSDGGPGILDMAGALGKRGLKAASGAIGRAGKGIASTVGSVATKAAPAAGGLLKGAGRVLGKAALPLAAGMALYDGVTGYQDAAENLGIEGREATTGEKASSAAGSVVSGLTFGLVDKKDASKGIANFFGAGPDKKDGAIQPGKAVDAAAVEASAGDMIYNRSGENVSAAMAPTIAPQSTIVNAPTTVSNTTNVAPMSPPRNTESAYRSYNRSRFQFA